MPESSYLVIRIIAHVDDKCSRNVPSGLSLSFPFSFLSVRLSDITIIALVYIEVLSVQFMKCACTPKL